MYVLKHCSAANTTFWKRWRAHITSCDLLNCNRSNLGCSSQQREVWMVLFRAALLKDVPIPEHGNHPSQLCQPFIPCQFEGTLLSGLVLSVLRVKCKKQSIFNSCWLWKCMCNTGKRRNSIWWVFSEVLHKNKKQLKRKISSCSVNRSLLIFFLPFSLKSYRVITWISNANSWFLL